MEQLQLLQLDFAPEITDFITDYADDTLGKGERSAFEEYMTLHPEVKIFADKSRQGRVALASMRTITASPDFTARLMRKIVVSREL